MSSLKCSMCHSSAVLLLALLLLWTGHCDCTKQLAATENGEPNTPLEKSVEPFYRLTENFLDLIQPVDKSVSILEEATRMLMNHSLVVEYFSDWQKASRRYALSMLGYAILTCLGLLFVIAVPLAGCCVFCCRCCCGKCGGRLHHMERKGARCRRNCYGASLTVLCTVMLCGIVLAFISNQLLRNSLDPKRPDYVFLQATRGLAAAAAQLQAAPDRARNDSVRTAALAAAVVRPAVAAAANQLRDRFVARLGVRAPLDNATAAFHLLADSGRLADALRMTWPALRDDLGHLNDTLRQASELLRQNQQVGGCPEAADRSDCELLRDRLARMRPGGDMDSAPELCNAQLSPWLPVGTVSGAVRRLSNSLAASETSLDDLAKAVVARLDTTNGPIAEAIATVNSSASPADQFEPVWAAAGRLAESVEFVRADVAAGLGPTNRGSQPYRSIEDLFADVSTYWHIVFASMASLALAILVLYYLGLAFGCCGEAPYDDARCCNRGAAAYLLLAGSGLAFLLAWLLMLATLLLFLAGGVLDTELCRYLTGRAGPAGYRALDAAANLYTVRFRADRVRENGAPFEALLGDCRSTGSDAAVRPGLAGALNLTALLEGTLPDFAYRRLTNRSVQLLNDQRNDLVSGLRLQPNLTELAAAAAAAADNSIDFAACSAALTIPSSSVSSGAVLHGDPDGAAMAALHRVSMAAAANLADHQAWSRIVDNLDSTLKRALERLANQSRRVQQLADARSRLVQMVGPVDSRGGSRLAQQLERAESQKSEAITYAIAAGTGDNLSASLSAGLAASVASVLSDAADCVAISAGLNSAARAPCRSALRPFNGFWAGLGLFLICLPACLLFSLKLVNLYRKSSKYERNYEEPDYMTYQGFCPSDTVPLDGRHRRGKATASAKGGGKSRAERASRGGGGGRRLQNQQQQQALAHPRDSEAAAVAVASSNRRCQQLQMQQLQLQHMQQQQQNPHQHLPQQQRYSQLPPYALEAYDY